MVWHVVVLHKPKTYLVSKDDTHSPQPMGVLTLCKFLLQCFNALMQAVHIRVIAMLCSCWVQWTSTLHVHQLTVAEAEVMTATCTLCPFFPPWVPHSLRDGN